MSSPSLLIAFISLTASVSASAAEIHCRAHDPNYLGDFRVAARLERGALNPVTVINEGRPVSLPETHSGVRGKRVIVAAPFLKSLDTGWGVRGTTAFYGPAYQFDFGTIEDTRGESIGLLAPKDPSPRFMGILYLYGGDAPTTLLPAWCVWK